MSKQFPEKKSILYNTILNHYTNTDTFVNFAFDDKCLKKYFENYEFSSEREKLITKALNYYQSFPHSINSEFRNRNTIILEEELKTLRNRKKYCWYHKSQRWISAFVCTVLVIASAAFAWRRSY